MSVSPSKLAAGAPASLQIRFAAGERPHLFWVSDVAPGAGGTRMYKVLSKSLPGGTVEAVLLEEDDQGGRRELTRVEVPRESPAGALARWVDTLGGELGARFRLYDLRSVQSPEQWAIVAGQLGWLRPA